MNESMIKVLSELDQKLNGQQNDLIEIKMEEHQCYFCFKFMEERKMIKWFDMVWTCVSCSNRFLIFARAWLKQIGGID